MRSIDKFRGKRITFLKKFIFKIICSYYGAEIYMEHLGKNVIFPHGLKGIVLNYRTKVEDGVTIFHQVTCGKGDMDGIMQNAPTSPFKGIILRKGAVICAGAKIICNRGVLVVGENTIIGANAVLTKSTGANEIWAGVPARKIGDHSYNKVDN